MADEEHSADPNLTQMLMFALDDLGATLERSNVVYEWPADEVEMHRAHMGSFSQRHDDMTTYRRQKIARHLAPLVEDYVQQRVDQATSSGS